MNSVEKGRNAEAQIVAKLVSMGHEVYLPAFGNTSCDLITSVDGRLCRIETKCVTTPNQWGTYEVALRQIRGTKSNVVVKKFNAEQCDMLAVYVQPKDVVAFYAAKPLGGRSTLNIKESDLPDLGELAEW